MTRPTGGWSPTFWLPTTQAYTGSTELRWSWSEFLSKLSLSRWWWDELDEKVEHFETLSLLVRYSTMRLSWHGLACSSTRLLWRPQNILGGKKITFLGRPHSLGRIYLQRRKCIRSSVFITIFLSQLWIPGEHDEADIRMGKAPILHDSRVATSLRSTWFWGKSPSTSGHLWESLKTGEAGRTILGRETENQDVGCTL